MVGYIYDSGKDYEKARAAYQKVIEKYPHSEFLDDARASLEHLGKSPDQWLRETQQETVAVKK
jgi:outer membrane protein assembly factor BamD (BamD/ComL family)